MLRILAMVSAMTGLPVTDAPPPVLEILSRPHIDAIGAFMDTRESRAAAGASREFVLSGAYMPPIPEFPDDPAYISIANDLSPGLMCAVLAHEALHHLQAVNGLPFDEVAAYSLQARWERRYPEGEPCAYLFGD